MKYWREVGQGSRNKTYRPEPEKNVAFSEEAVAAAKRRQTEARRAVEDANIEREIEEQLK